MKKIVCIILVFINIFCFTGCYQDLYYNSLEEYVEQTNTNKFGFSSVEIDHPDYFLPSPSFLKDFNYIEGIFAWREDDPLRGLLTSNVHPEVSFLCLKYEEDIYYDAKKCVLEQIEPFDDKYYVYNNYCFYENSNFIALKESRQFPKEFTMACYNDENNVLIFIGMFSNTIAGPSCLEEIYINDLDNNWISFIDTYYGEYYDFSK